jgi:hypothetical protein
LCEAAARMQAEAKALEDALTGGVQFSENLLDEGLPVF